MSVESSNLTSSRLSFTQYSVEFRSELPLTSGQKGLSVFYLLLLTLLLLLLLCNLFGGTSKNDWRRRPRTWKTEGSPRLFGRLRFSFGKTLVFLSVNRVQNVVFIRLTYDSPQVYKRVFNLAVCLPTIWGRTGGRRIFGPLTCLNSQLAGGKGGRDGTHPWYRSPYPGWRGIGESNSSLHDRWHGGNYPL